MMKSLMSCLTLTSFLQLNSENELDLLSILPKGWQQDFSPTMYPYMLMPSTRATFLARRYRFIVELDLSPSTGIVVRQTQFNGWLLVSSMNVAGTNEFEKWLESSPSNNKYINQFCFSYLLCKFFVVEKYFFLCLQNIHYKTLVGYCPLVLSVLGVNAAPVCSYVYL